ncbi:MAG: sialate O-acetylesterase [Lentisphaeraceae bacterium]|nr:sialate O-acetylesterase [Lentisphaeraceae bacterium]
MKIMAIILLISSYNLFADNHLFILSGQSNMARLDPGISFIPKTEKRFGKDKTIVIKDAQGGQPISRWYKNWKDTNGTPSENNGDLYDRLMEKVKKGIKGKKLKSITFLWMQGESDMKKEKLGVYKKSLLGLFEQLKIDLKNKEINFVIGRLSDYGIKRKRKPNPNWVEMRKIQVAIADADKRIEWVDTDDLNDGIAKGKTIKNDLHYSDKGYSVFGERLADKAIQLIEKFDK